MSAIPPAPIASALQAGSAARDQVRSIDADKNAQARAAAITSGPDTILEVETTDADTKVHTESGGAGSQGRQDSPPEETPGQEMAAPPGITTDETGHQHIDLSV
jgi:hypothetical protein